MVEDGVHAAGDQLPDAGRHVFGPVVCCTERPASGGVGPSWPSSPARPVCG
ncbi:hypothetical protein ACFQ3Z_04555 [Streptomyces nogalater]